MPTPESDMNSDMKMHDVKIILTGKVFAEDIQDAKEAVKDAFLFPPAHLIDVHVMEVSTSEGSLQSMY